jgi:TonB family protein
VVRKSNSKTTSKTTTATDNRDQQVSDNRRRAAALISQTANSLRDLSSSTEIVMPGEGFGEAYASYASAVRSVYERNWIPPEDTTDDNAITKVTVTIGNTGKVLSASIIRPSGETVVDRSVQRTLDRVTFIRPFPDGSKDKQRTYTINFNLKAKRGLG